MNSEPSKKHKGDLLDLEPVELKDIKPHKIYYIRMRNKDKSKNIWGSKQDFIGRVNLIDDSGISFDGMYSRQADPRERGQAVWKKLDNRVLILKEALLKKNKDDNTMFFIDAPASAKTKKEGFKSKTRKFLKRFLGKTRKNRSRRA